MKIISKLAQKKKAAETLTLKIVTTDVGDARFVIGDTEGCYFTDNNAEDCAKKLMNALEFAELYDRTNGRQRMKQLGYCNDKIAQRIYKIYNDLKNQ